MRQRYFGVCYHRKENFFEPEKVLSKNYTCAVTDNYFEKTPMPSITTNKKGGQRITTRYKMIGDAIMPVVSEWIGKQIILSGLLQSTSFDKELKQPVFPMKWEGKISKLNPMDTSSIPIYGGMVYDWNIYYGSDQCQPSYTPKFNIPTITTKSNLLSPSMQKHSTHRSLRRRIGLKQGESLSQKDQMINMDFIEWASSFPVGWTK